MPQEMLMRAATLPIESEPSDGVEPERLEHASFGRVYERHRLSYIGISGPGRPVLLRYCR